MRVVIGVVLFLTCIGGLQEAGAQISGVFPLLDCVAFNPATRELTAGWGYRNDNQFAQSIPVGTLNFFAPGGNLGQPTFFLPGEHHLVFSTTVNVSTTPQVLWDIVGNSVTASNDPRLHCGYVPGTMIWRGAWDSGAAYREDDVVTYQESVWRAQQDNTNATPEEGAAWELVVQRSVRSASQPYTFPRNGVLTITDPAVSPTSVLIVQYVGANRSGDSRIVSVGNGQFTVRGTSQRQLRYILSE
jgi:hypothetical protein